jgi:hypothetical protein
MPHYAALDVSNDQTAIHVVDEAGRTVWRGKRASDPEALAAARRRAAGLAPEGLGPGSRKADGVQACRRGGRTQPGCGAACRMSALGELLRGPSPPDLSVP